MVECTQLIVKQREVFVKTVPKPDPKEKLVKCMIVAPVVRMVAVDHINTTCKQLRSKVHGVHLKTPKFPHVTLTSPFVTTYERASTINIGIFLHDFVLGPTDAFLEGLDCFVGEAGDLDTLYAKVRVSDTFLARITMIRKTLRAKEGITFIGKDYDEGKTPKLHVTIAQGEGLASNQAVQAFIGRHNEELLKDERIEGSLTLGSLTCCLFAKYGDEWKHLSHPPHTSP